MLRVAPLMTATIATGVTAAAASPSSSSTPAAATATRVAAAATSSSKGLLTSVDLAGPLEASIRKAQAFDLEAFRLSRLVVE